MQRARHQLLAAAGFAAQQNRPRGRSKTQHPPPQLENRFTFTHQAKVGHPFAARLDQLEQDRHPIGDLEHGSRAQQRGFDPRFVGTRPAIQTKGVRVAGCIDFEPIRLPAEAQTFAAQKTIGERSALLGANTTWLGESWLQPRKVDRVMAAHRAEPGAFPDPGEVRVAQKGRRQPVARQSRGRAGRKRSRRGRAAERRSTFRFGHARILVKSLPLLKPRAFPGRHIRAQTGILGQSRA